MGIPNYQTIIDLVKKGSTLEAQEKIMELREAAIELQEQNIELREKVQALEKKLEVSSKIEYEKPYYWLVNSEGKDGPYCQLCYDKFGLLIRLQDLRGGIWRCESCGNNFEDKTYRPPQLRGGDMGWL